MVFSLSLSLLLGSPLFYKLYINLFGMNRERGRGGGGEGERGRGGEGEREGEKEVREKGRKRG